MVPEPMRGDAGDPGRPDRSCKVLPISETVSTGDIFNNKVFFKK